ncbi:MAG: GtrA family protein [Steroidobacteraceae bacterium]
MKPADMIARTVELARYSAVGLICFATATGTLAVLHEWGHVPYFAGYISAFLVSAALGFVLHGRFTFADAGPQNASLARYLVLNAVLFGINSLAFAALVEIAHVWYIGASTSLAAVNVPVSFLVHRRLSYGLSHCAVSASRS